MEPIGTFETNLRNKDYDIVRIQLFDGHNLPSSWFDTIDPFVNVRVVLPECACRDDRELATWRSLPKANDPTPNWDQAGVILFRPDPRVLSLEVSLYNDNSIVPDNIVSSHRIDIPDVDVGDRVYQVPAGDGFINIGLSRTSTKNRYLSDNDISTLLPIKLPNCEESPTATLECITRSGNAQCVLWIPGRNDTWMHPHVARVFLDHGTDVYILHYRGLGMNHICGYFGDALFTSHVESGSFDMIHDELDTAMSIIDSRATYATRICGGHSTGGTIICSYIMSRGDDRFDGYYFNAPFLSWDYLTSNFMESTMLECTPALEKLRIPTETTIQQGGSPNYWLAKVYAQNEFPVGSRSLLNPHVTLGFASAVTSLFQKLRSDFSPDETLTNKPVGLVTSIADDLINTPATVKYMKHVGKSIIPDGIIKFGAHDVFLSVHTDTVDVALSHLAAFLKQLKKNLSFDEVV